LNYRGMKNFTKFKLLLSIYKNTTAKVLLKQIYSKTFLLKSQIKPAPFDIRMYL